MADIQDVLNTLVAQVAGYVYPSGMGNPPVDDGGGIRVYSNWPIPEQIDVDMPLDISHVSIFDVGPDKNVARYSPKAHVMSITAPTLSLVSHGATVTVGGAMPSPFTPHNMAVLIGNAPFIYPVQPTDTLISIATGLAALIAAKYPGTTNSGPVITVPTGVLVRAARVGTTGSVAQEWERQIQPVQLTVWAPSIAARATIGGAIKTALSQISFLTMPDGFGARVRYQRQMQSDEVQRARVYRRDMFYEVEYATTTQQNVATVVAVETTLETPAGVEILQQTS